MVSPSETAGGVSGAVGSSKRSAVLPAEKVLRAMASR